MKLLLVILTVLAGLALAGFLVGLGFYYFGEPGWDDAFEGGVHMVLQVDPAGDAAVDKNNTQKIRKVVEERLEELGIRRNRRVVKAVADRRVLIQLPFERYEQGLVDLLSKWGYLEFKFLKEGDADPADSAPEGYEWKTFDKGDESERVLVEKETALAGCAVRSVAVQHDDLGGLTLEIALTPDGAGDFGEMTEENIGRRLAIVFEDRVISAPKIQEAIWGGRLKISGRYSREKVQELKAVLEAGAVPVSARAVETKRLNKRLWDTWN